MKIEAKGHKIQGIKLVKIDYWSKYHIFQLDFGFMLLKILRICVNRAPALYQNLGFFGRAQL